MTAPPAFTRTKKKAAKENIMDGYISFSSCLDSFAFVSSTAFALFLKDPIPVPKSFLSFLSRLSLSVLVFLFSNIKQILLLNSNSLDIGFSLSPAASDVGGYLG